MNRFRASIVALAAFALVLGPFGVLGQAGAADGSAAAVSAKKKSKKCQKLKGKKKRQCLNRGAKGGKGKTPWAGSPYKPGITCAMSPEMQRKYAKHGLTCIDLGLGVTTLIEL